MKETTEVLELILKIFALIGGISTAIIFIRKWWKEYTVKMNHFFARTWSNEGDIGYSPENYIHIDITVDHYDIGGEVRLYEREEGDVSLIFLISGKRYFSKAFCEILKVRDGKISNHGSVILIKVGKRLKWRLKKGNPDLFPKEEVLF